MKARYDLTDNRDWNVKAARKALAADPKWKRNVLACLYRPFDKRWCYFSQVAMDYPRRELIDHVAGRENLCLLLPRQISFLPWRHAAVSTLVAESCTVSNKTKEQNYNFPLYLYPESGGLALQSVRRANISDAFMRRIGAQLTRADLKPETILAYIYAVLHSPTYRSRYAEFLKMDFPKIPLPASDGLYAEIARVGTALIMDHLAHEKGERPSQSSAKPIGNRHVISTVKWSEGKVWLDKNASVGFAGISRDVWEFQVGSYQVCEKWLKDRKGQTLSPDDVDQYRSLVGTIARTIKQMEVVDAVIARHGGWPGAFATKGEGKA